MLQVVAGIIQIDGYVLICRRHSDSLRFPLKWEFPGGKIELGEGPRKALDRELHEELGIAVKSAEILDRYIYRYEREDDFELIFFEVSEFDNTIQNRQFDRMAWVRSEQLPDYELLDGDKPLLKKNTFKNILADRR